MPLKKDESTTAIRTIDMTVFGPRLSAWIDQNGAENAIMNGVTPMMIPAQKAASPGSVMPSSERNKGRKDMMPIMEMPAPIWIAQTRYMTCFQFFISPLLSFLVEWGGFPSFSYYTP